MKFALLPIFAWLFTYLCIYLLSKSGRLYSASWRQIFISATVVWGMWTTLLTEVLGLFNQLTRTMLIIGWAILLLITLLICLWVILKQLPGLNTGNLKNKGISIPVYIWRWLFNLVKPDYERESKETPPFRDPWILTVDGIIVLQLVLIFLTGSVYPPSNYDSMTYHLSRILHWEQAQSVGHYATSIDRQVYMPPLAEFGMMQFHLLTGSDQFLFFTQWFSMVVCAIGVMEIVAQFGADRLRQRLAALLAVSIPIGILEASSTQNDWVVAAYLVSFYVFSIAFVKIPSNEIEKSEIHDCQEKFLLHDEKYILAIWIGLSLGLTLLAKGTAYMLAIPGAFWVGVELIKHKGQFWKGIRLGVIISILVIVINFGHLARNAFLYGQPIEPRAEYATEKVTVMTWMSNITRSIAMHVPRPTGETGLINTMSLSVSGWLRFVHQITGIDPEDPSVTFGTGNVFLEPVGSNTHEDFAGNTIHAVLIISSMVLIIGAEITGIKKWQNSTIVSLYALTLIAGFLIFNALIKWQIYASRLQLPQFVLWCPIMAIVLFPKNWRLAWGVVMITALVSFNWTFQNQTRPVHVDALYNNFSHDQMYFLSNMSVYSEYRDITKLVADSNCQKVGLVIRRNTMEYPFWVMLRNQGFTGEIEHIQVKNEMAKYEKLDYKPCAIISEWESDKFSDWRMIRVGDFWVYLE
jgi:hypothetical protein